MGVQVDPGVRMLQLNNAATSDLHTQTSALWSQKRQVIEKVPQLTNGAASAATVCQIPTAIGNKRQASKDGIEDSRRCNDKQCTECSWRWQYSGLNCLQSKGRSMRKPARKLRTRSNRTMGAECPTRQVVHVTSRASSAWSASAGQSRGARILRLRSLFRLQKHPWFLQASPTWEHSTANACFWRLTMISEGSIRFYFDLTSPYSYLAFHKLQQYAKLWESVQILYYPASLGAIMKSASNSPPGQNLMRKDWLHQDIPRAAKMWQVPFTSTWPSPFPITTLGPNRFLLEVGKTCGQNALIHAIGRLFDNYWTDPCVNPCDVSSLKASLPASFSETEFQEILTRSKSPEGKQALMQTTQEALDKGAFGLPYMVVSKTNKSGVSSEITVFGSDRFDHLGWFLEQDCWSGPVVSKL